MTHPNTSSESSPTAAVERLTRATNAHRVDDVVACFAPDYRLESPLHPARSFAGQEQVRRNWTQIFGAVPDIATRVVAQAVDGATIWTEWEMAGTRRDGQSHLMRGIFVFGVADGLIRSGRMFLEVVDESGSNMDAALQRQLGR